MKVMKKKTLIIVGVVVALIVGFITYFVITDLNQEEKLKNELNEISNLVNTKDIDMEKVNKRLDTIVTTGEYAIVEKAVKEYLSDSFDNSIEMANLLNDERITKSLTIENYKEDGKDFKNTKVYLKETIIKLENCKNKYYEFLTEEKAMSYIDNENLDSYYIDFYKNEIMSDIEEVKNDKTIENSINDVISLLQNTEKVIDFLIENKDNWEVNEENIIFNSELLSNKYNELIENL